MDFQKTTELSIARVLKAGQHGERALFSIEGKPGIWSKVKRRDSSYLTAVHEGGILALKESMSDGESVFKICEFVRAVEVEREIAACLQSQRPTARRVQKVTPASPLESMKYAENPPWNDDAVADLAVADVESRSGCSGD